MNQRDINEKKLFDQFHDQELPVSNDIWDAISVQLDSQDKKKRRPIFFWILGTLFLGGLSAIPLIIKFQHSNAVLHAISTLRSNDNSIASKSIIDESIHNEKKNTTEGCIESDKKLIINNLIIKNNKTNSLSIDADLTESQSQKKMTGNYFNNTGRIIVQNEIANQVIANNSPINSEITNVSNIPIDHSPVNNSEATSLISDNSINAPTSPLQIDISHLSYSKLPEPENTGSAHPMDISDHPNFLKNDFVPIPSLGILPLTFDLMREDPNLLPGSLSYQRPIVHRKNLEWYAELNSGIGIVRKNMKSNNAESNSLAFRNLTEKPLYTWNSGLIIGTSLYQTWTASTGLELTRIIEEFDYTYEYATKIEVKIDPSTQQPLDTSIIRGTLVERGPNSFSCLNIPVNIGYHKRLGSWKIGLEAGLGINIQTQARGKILIADQDVRHVENLSGLYRKRVGASARLSILFQRNLSRNFSILLRPQYVKYLSSWTQSSSQPELKYEMVNLQLGLRKYF